MSEVALLALIRSIAARDRKQALRLLATEPELAVRVLAIGATRQGTSGYYFEEIPHYAYAGDTALHMAAAAHQVSIAKRLVSKGALVGARNRRGAEPLHYAADGMPGSPAWDPEGQAEVVAFLIASGADPNALDKSGVAPLHRAVRTRCSPAVRALLANGADPHLTNKSGSTPLQLATLTTGRGGSGSVMARLEQRKIIELLAARSSGGSILKQSALKK
jgi:hypothetical protein